MPDVLEIELQDTYKGRNYLSKQKDDSITDRCDTKAVMETVVMGLGMTTRLAHHA